MAAPACRAAVASRAAAAWRDGRAAATSAPPAPACCLRERDAERRAANKRELQPVHLDKRELQPVHLEEHRATVIAYNGLLGYRLDRMPR
eukprot:86343-Prymnesium_polylepis.1